MNFILGVKEVDEIENKLMNLDEECFKDYVSNTENIIKSIENYLSIV